MHDRRTARTSKAPDDLPPGVTLFAEAVESVIERLRTRMISPEDAKGAIIKRHVEEISRYEAIAMGFSKEEA
jgi:hypothetical protein